MTLDEHIRNITRKLSNSEILESISPLKIPRILWDKMNTYARLMTETCGQDTECSGYLLADFDDDSGIPKYVTYSTEKASGISVLLNTDIPDDPVNGKPRKVIGMWHSHPGDLTTPSGTDWKNMDLLFSEFPLRPKASLYDRPVKGRYYTRYDGESGILKVADIYDSNTIEIPMPKETFNKRDFKEGFVEGKLTVGPSYVYSLIIHQESHKAERPLKGKDYGCCVIMDDMEKKGRYLPRDMQEIELIDMELPVDIDESAMLEEILETSLKDGRKIREISRVKLNEKKAYHQSTGQNRKEQNRIEHNRIERNRLGEDECPPERDLEKIVRKKDRIRKADSCAKSKVEEKLDLILENMITKDYVEKLESRISYLEDRLKELEEVYRKADMRDNFRPYTHRQLQDAIAPSESPAYEISDIISKRKSYNTPSKKKASSPRKRKGGLNPTNTAARITEDKNFKKEQGRVDFRGKDDSIYEIRLKDSGGNLLYQAVSLTSSFDIPKEHRSGNLHADVTRLYWDGKSYRRERDYKEIEVVFM